MCGVLPWCRKRLAEARPANARIPEITLPDYLEPGLDIVLVGINPGAYSVQAGHYYAGPGNRFWNAANRAGLFGEPLRPENDARVLEFGIGLTDVVKRPTCVRAKDLRAADYRRWAPVLKEKIRRFRPRIVCFQGIGGYRNYLRHGEGLSRTAAPKAGPSGPHAGVVGGVSGSESQRSEHALLV